MALGQPVEESDPELAELLKKLDQPSEPPENVGPPGSGSTRKKPEKRSRRNTTKTASPASLEGKLTEMFMLMSMGIGALGDEQCMTLVAKNGPAMAKSLDKLASENPSVKKALTATMEGSAWVGVIMSVGPTLYGIASHHMGPKEKPEEEAAPEQPKLFEENPPEPQNLDTGGVTLAWPT